MTREEKQLLLRDLCARLPYGVKIHIEYTFKSPYNVHIEKDTDLVEFNVVKGEFLALTSMNPLSPRIRFPLENIRPYLRPMSSMTEDENEELKYVIELGLQALEGEEGHNTVSAAPAAFEVDFYNKRHFDYRGLIEKFLALPAPNDMYKTE